MKPWLQRKLIYKESALETALIPIRIFFQGKMTTRGFLTADSIRCCCCAHCSCYFLANHPIYLYNQNKGIGGFRNAISAVCQFHG